MLGVVEIQVIIFIVVYSLMFILYYLLHIGVLALIMLFVVVSRTVGPVVVLFMFICALVPGMRVGTLALPYHLN
jgi:hypothetical protein